jgi:hypothetical protein
MITLPYQIPSRNQIDKMHWAKKTRLRQSWELLVRNQMALNKIKPCQSGDVFDITVISYRHRRIDPDNLIGGAKQLLDALSRESFIWDDSFKYLNPEYKQILIKKHIEPYTTVERERVV